MAKAKKKKGKSTEQIYQEVTDRVIESLQQNEIPWNKPWVSQEGFCNYISKRKYRGINPMLLQMSSSANGYETPYWLTFNQASELSVKKFLKENKLSDNEENRKQYNHKENYKGIRKGEKSTTIIYWDNFEVEDENEEDGKRRIFYLKYIPVFNTDQTDLDIEYKQEETKDFEPIERAAEIIENWKDKPTINHLGYDSAHYLPDRDMVELPKQNTFKSPELYYKTLYHECVHSTAHKSRLHRVKDWAKFGSDPYAKEELVAELGASYLTNYAGIENIDTEQNTEAYIKNWIKRLEENPKLIVQAGGQAQKASDYILGTKYEDKE
jgi:antirestriction protein ArdC